MSSNNIWGADAPEEETRLLIDVLQEWSLALEQGTEATRLPDPAYRWRRRQPSVDEIDALVAEIDQYIEREWRNWGKPRGFDVPAELSRLPSTARLALMQDLDQTLAA
ncbi:MAG: hypothetical protein EXR60_07135 [Dehalococcoidia bacterium]|nr:hypothetical protein [Dehalococcoidia bacterium]